MASYSCFSGRFGQLSATASVPACVVSSPGSLVRGASSLQVVFSISNACAAPVSLIPGLPSTAALAVVIVVPIGAVLILVAIVLLAVPGLRTKVFPFRGRPYHRSQLAKPQMR